MFARASRMRTRPVATTAPVRGAGRRARLSPSNQLRLAALGHGIPAQAKLEVSRPGDAHEREADRVADAVMRGPRLDAEGGAGAGGVRPLDRGVRAGMEARMGASFAGVRLHTDDAAAAAARGLNAKAFTVGNDIYFKRGGYDPASTEGQRLLAHELAHVAQQRGGETPVVSRDVDEEAPETGEPEEDLDPEEENDPDNDVSDGDTEMAGAPLGMEQEPEPNEIDLGQEEPVEMGKGKGDKGKGDKKKPKAVITSIVVDLAKQHLTVKSSDGSLDDDFDISSGKGCPNTADNPCKTGNEAYCTPNVTDIAPGNKFGADHKNNKGDAMAWYVGVDDTRGVGIHNSQTANGTPKSHGCVRTGKGGKGLARAKSINNNSNSNTKITIKGKAPTKPWKLSRAKQKSGFPLCPLPPEPKKKTGGKKKK